MKIVAEIGSSWLPKEYPLKDAIKAALDCGVDMVKIQFWQDGQRFAMRRGGRTGLEKWALRPDYVLDLADRLAHEHKRPVLGVSAFLFDDVEALYSRDVSQVPLAFIKTAAYEYQYAELADAVSRYSAANGVPVYASVPADGCLSPANYWSPLPITWLQCIPHYPCQASDYSTLRLSQMLDVCPGLVGISDHTPDLSLLRQLHDYIGVLAVWEKHFCYKDALRDRCPDGGPWSVGPEKLKELVQGR